MRLVLPLACCIALLVACSAAPATGSVATVVPTDLGGRASPDVVAADGGASAAGPAATVVRVVDGDTLEIRLAGTTERVRLIGIDTPESVKRDSPVECFGKEASARLAALLPEGTSVEVVRDAELRDPYGRLLAYLFRQPDGLFVNLAMVTDGFANQLTIAPNVTFADDFRAAAAQARRSGLGLWRACPDPDRLFS